MRELIIMAIGLGVLALLGFAFWLLWSKLHNIEQKLFKMHDEMGSSLKYIEEQLHLTQRMIERMDENIPPVPQSVKDVWKEQEFLNKYE